MRAYLLLSKVLYTKRQTFKILIHVVVIFYIIFYVVNDFYGQYSNYAFFIHPFKYGNFDTIVYETTEKDLEEQITKENITGKASISVPLLQCKYICNDKEFFEYGACAMGGFTGESFQSMTDVALSGSLVKKDNELLHAEDTILLTDAIAMKIGADVGDTVSIQCYTSVSDTEREGFFNYHFDSDRKYAFKVGAIYRDNIIPLRAIIAMPELKEIIIENYPEREKQDNVAKSLFMTFIKYKDFQSGILETENFVPIYTSLQIEYGEDWKNYLDETDYGSYENYAESMRYGTYRRFAHREDLLALAESNMVINTNAILFKTVLATAAISLLFISQNYKTLKLNRKSFGILSSSGMRQRKIFFYVGITSFIEQLAALGLSFLKMYMSYLSYARPENDKIFSVFVTVRAYGPLVIGAVAASILAGIFAAWMVSKKKIQEALSAE